MGLITTGIPSYINYASGANAQNINPPGIHLVITEDDLLRRLFPLYRGTGGEVTTLLTNTASGASTEIKAGTQHKLAENLEEIRSAFGLTKDELARICRVQSRKSLYNWINGETAPRRAAMNRIYDLSLTARAWLSSGFTADRDELHMPIFKDQSVFDLLSQETIDREQILFAGSRLSLLSTKRDSLADPFV